MRFAIALVLVACARPMEPPALRNVELVGEPPRPRPAPKCEPPCAAKSDHFADRMAALECKTQCLKEQIWRAKSRIVYDKF
jgi:hypothetical protein